MSLLLAALNRHATQRPQDTALVGAQTALDWSELAEAVNQRAAQLQGTRVLATLFDNGPDWVITDLAALQAGCVHLPLPGFFNDEQLRHAVRDAGADRLLTDQPLRVAALFPEAVAVAPLSGTGGQRFALRGARVPDWQDSCCKITYTSGSTGQPRGVRLSVTALESTAGALVSAVQAEPADCALVTLPLPILLENIGSVYVPLLAGAQLAVPAPGESGIIGAGYADPARLAAALQRYRPSAMIVPPGLLKLLVQLARTTGLPDSLRYVACGGAPVARSLLADAAQAGIPVYQGYGLSEAASVVAVNTATHNRPGSVGRPLPRCRVRIAADGEILVAGIAGTGYLRDPLSSGQEELHTGDLGFLDADGYLYVTGRRGNRIVTALGRNLAPEWLEAELQAHPDIMQAAVFDAGLTQPVAVLVGGRSVEPLQLQQAVTAVNARLPDYARIGAWLAADAPFSRDGGELSAAGALRRSVVAERYRMRFDAQSGRRYG